MPDHTDAGGGKNPPPVFSGLSKKFPGFTDPGFFDPGIRGLVLLTLIFFIYLTSLSPNIFSGDSSLFAAASFSLGSAHPPGYPLYVMLGKLITFLPFGSVAYRVNLLSAIMGGLTCLMVYKSSMLLTKNSAASWASALIAGLVPLFFTESIKAEVYTLNAFLSMCVLFLCLKALEGEGLRSNVLVAVFLVGLGMGNHHTIGLMGLVIIWPLLVRRRELTIGFFALAPLFFIIGFSVNLLLYVRSLVLLDRGLLILYSNAYGTWQGLMHVILRKAYGSGGTAGALSGMAEAGASPWLLGLKNAFSLIVYPSIVPVLPFLLIGLVFALKKPGVRMFPFFAALLYLTVLSRMALASETVTIKTFETVSPYFLPTIPLLYVTVSMGIASVLSFFEARRFGSIKRALPAIVVLSPFVLLPYTVRDYSLDKSFIAYDYGRDLIEALPPKSLLLNNADNALFTSFYMRSVERLREDILVMNTKGKEDVYGIQSSPPWKYASLYPDFYRETKSSIKEINRDFALRGKLFANSHVMLTETVSSHYSHYPFLLSAALFPREGAEEGRLKEGFSARFRQDFKKLNYERVLETPFQTDRLSTELFAVYAFSSLQYGDMLVGEGAEGEGTKREGETYRRAAFEMSDPRLFLWPYASFLIREGKRDSALALISSVGAAPGYEEFAERLKQRALSTVGAGG